MAYLFDTNVFIRIASRNDPLREVCLNALRKLRLRNETLCYTPQVLGEFWNVCTRPVTAAGGLGLSLEATELIADSNQSFVMRVCGCAAVTEPQAVARGCCQSS